MAEGANIRSISIGGQGVFILLSALPFWIGIYLLIPTMVAREYSLLAAFTVGILWPLIILILLSLLLAARQSQNGLKGVMYRLRLQPMKLRDWYWVFFLLLVSVVGYLSLGGTSAWIANNYPSLSPPRAFSLIQTSHSFLGISLKGNWWVLVLHISVLLLNVFGEELWFRGILFPRQETTYHKWAWLVHGLSYHLWHMFYPWDLLRLLPGSLAYGFVIQKTRNTWTTIAAHFLFNGLGLINTISGIMR